MLIALVLFVGGCGYGDRCNREYLFELPFSVYPINDTLQIGDTLWIEAHFDHGMPDVNSNDVVVLEDFSFYSELDISKVDSSEIEEGAYSFNYHIMEGNYSNIPFSGGWTVGTIQYDYAGGVYNFGLGMETLEKGLFCFSMNSILLNGEHIPSPDIDKACDSESIKIAYVINNGDSVNYHLTQYSPIESINSLTEEEFSKGGAYCFVVVE